MKRVINILVLCLCLHTAWAQQLVQVRCYFDGNVANAQYFSVPNLESLDQPMVVDVSALSKGVHKMYLDVRDNNGRWSLYDFSLVQVMGGVQMATLNRMEYYFDNDPGTGNGLQIALAGQDFEGDLEISVAGLSNGVHKLYVRVRDNAGTWSLYHGKLIHVVAGHYQPVVAAEYFFDTDPGFGNGTPLDVSGQGIDAAFGVSLAGVSRGVHKFYLRVKDATGQWSLYAEHNLQVLGGVGMQYLQVAEYFFDTDPGFGQGFPLLIAAGTASESNYIMNVPSNLTLGSHILYLRLRDQAGQWSLYAHDTLNVCEMVLPDLTVTGPPCAGSVVNLSVTSGYTSYQWNTGAVTSSIVIEESGTYIAMVSDGDCSTKVMTTVEFIELPVPTISQSGNDMTALPDGYTYQWYQNGVLIPGATGQTYTGTADGLFTVEISDGQCFSMSANFSFVYQTIAESEEYAIDIFPNPSSDIINLRTMAIDDYELRLYDQTGRIAANQKFTGQQLQLSVAALASGHYILVLQSEEVMHRTTVVVMH